MMPRMHPSAVLSSGFLLLSTGLSSCTFLPMFSSGGQETPRTLGARMEKHTEVLQKDIGARNASQPKSMEAAAYKKTFPVCTTAIREKTNCQSTECTV